MAEQAAEQAGDTEALQQLTGVSKRQANRQTEQARQRDKASRDAEIIRLHREGHKQSDIAMHISKYYQKITQSGVCKIIKKNYSKGTSPRRGT